MDITRASLPALLGSTLSCGPTPNRPEAQLVILQPPVATSHCPSGMVWIEGGRFTMGSDTPAEVEGICMDVTEVTVDAYARCSGCTNPDTGQYCNWGTSGRGITR